MSLRRHTLYNLVGQLTPLVLALLTIPAYLSVVGEARYGVLAIVWLLVGYFSLFDLGLGAATAQRLSTLADAEAAERVQVFWSALLASLVLGLVGSLFAWPLAHAFFARGLSIDSALRTELLAALPWVVLTLPVATLPGVLTGALQARERFLEINLIAIVGGTAVQVLPLLVALRWGPRLEHLVQAVLVARLFSTVVLLWRCSRHVTQGKPMAGRLDTARGLLRYGGWVSVTAVVGPLMVILDRFLIGAVLGVRAVSHYTIPFQLAERTTVLSASLNYALFPRLAQAPDPASRLHLALQALRVLTVLVSPLVALALVLIGPFLGWWISAEMAVVSGPVAQVLLAGFWINSLAMVPYTQLQAAGRPDLVAKCHLLELLPYLALLFLALDNWGLMGAAIVFASRTAADFLLLAHLAGLLAKAGRLLAWPAVGLIGILATGADGMPALLVLGALLAWSCTQARAVMRLVTA
jgi:O-antigen/teichoic acid export membrane protein